jgi:hypothetical protein
MSAGAPILMVDLDEHTSVAVAASGTVLIRNGYVQLDLRWPMSMSPADRAAKCAALSHLFAAEGIRYADQDAALVPAQRTPEARGPLHTPPVPAPRKSGGER